MPGLVGQKYSPIQTIQAFLWPSAFKSDTEVDTYNHATCPRDFVNRLPLDLLSRILVEVLSYAQDNEIPISPFVAWQTPAPFFLSRVCKFWMSVVNSTSAMWGSIVIWKPTKRQLNRIEQWMVRVGSYPLQWSLIQSDVPNEEEEEATVRALELLARRCSTWRGIELTLRCERFPAQFLTHLLSLREGERSPLLQSATITLKLRHEERTTYDSDSPVFPTYAAWNLLGSLPCLSHLRWDAPFTPGPSVSHNLKILDLKSPISVEEFLERIPYCCQLEELFVSNLSKPNSTTFLPEHMAIDVDPTPRKIMPVVRRLGLSSQRNLSPILRNIAAPMLVILDLDSTLPLDLGDFREFLSDSHCTLEALRLHFRSVRIDATSVELWLQVKELESVTTLHLLNMEFDDRNLQMLHRPGQDGQTLLPRLKDLTIGTCNQDVNVGVLLRMLGSRFWTVPRVGQRIVPADELVTAEIYVRRLTVEMVKYGEMIDKNGEGMKDRPIRCRFTL